MEIDKDEAADKASHAIKTSLNQCRSIVSDYRDLLAANANEPDDAQAPPMIAPEQIPDS